MGSKQTGDLKTELDEVMKQKIEVEVQHVAISKAIEHWNVEYEVMVAEQKKVLLEQVEMMKKLEDAEEKAMELKMQAEKLQVTCEEILEKEQVWEARNMMLHIFMFYFSFVVGFNQF
ncbi:putative WPP domain-interacting protein/3 [Helianthus annuus]|nr:putative WPP domain-interacting protein/3 [Helianthus annuus]